MNSNKTVLRKHLYWGKEVCISSEHRMNLDYDFDIKFCAYVKDASKSICPALFGGG